jgi:signal transduction histidine kinase
MSDGLTKTEAALLEALQRERLLLQQRDWVIGIILHELANAATVLGGSVELLHLAPAGTPDHNLALKKLQHGSATLGQLLAGLRELIDSTGAAPELKEEEFADYVCGLIRDPVLLDSAEARRISVTVRGAGTRWRISPRLMRHSLGNMLRNALRYSPPGTPVTVKIGRRGVRRWIHVMNHGRKIPAEVVANLFSPGKKSGGGGMGFGLYISQICADRMGGRLVFGTTNRATVFAILLDETPDAALAEMPQAPGLAS